MTLLTIDGVNYAHVIFTKLDNAGHRAEVEEFMAWLEIQPDASARAIFEGLDKMNILENTGFYRQKAFQAKPKCGAFAFVGLTGIRAALMETILALAGPSMKIIPNLADAQKWISQSKVPA